jgi:adenylate cyclase
MHNPPRILIVDDNEMNRDILVTRLETQGYDLTQAVDGEEALAAAREQLPDLILLDVMMPKLDGIEVTRRLKSDKNLPFMPIILVTAKAASEDVVTGLEAGADEYLTKPIDQMALVARVKSVLRLKELHDQVAAWNRTLEERVQQQLSEIERAKGLERFLSPQIAKLILSSGNDTTLESHRRPITVVFCDLRGFTAFSEATEPEEVMSLLREYHSVLGTIVHKHEGTVERFAGDAIMVFFNDPVPCPDPSLRATRMALEMRERVGELLAKWRKLGYELGFGVGIAHGYATLGRIGFEGRFDYGAVGTVVNLAARLCADAKDGQILVESKVAAAIEESIATETAGELQLKGFQRAVRVFNVTGQNSDGKAQTSGDGKGSELAAQA